MQVGKLIEILQGHDPEAEVRIASQPTWPWEHSIVGVATREMCGREDIYDDQADAGCVFIIEGQQLKHASRILWEVYEA